MVTVTTDSNGNRLAIAKAFATPDGYTYTVYEDGSWKQHTWDGLFIRDNKSLLPADATPADDAAARAMVSAKMGLYQTS